jgi:hypothetical protein
MGAASVKRIQVCAVLIAAPMIAGLIAHATAQSRPAPAGQLRQIAYLKASNPDTRDHFGNGGTVLGDSVTISGDENTVAIGAPNESGSSSGINGTQNDNSLYSSGAVYVFVRRGMTSSAARWRSVATAGPWWSARAAKTAPPEA